MIHQMQNWAFNDYTGALEYITNPFPEIENGDVFILCNIARCVPNSLIFAGKNDLMFLGCNLVNCNLPTDAEVYDCNTAQNTYLFEGVK